MFYDYLEKEVEAAEKSLTTQMRRITSHTDAVAIVQAIGELVNAKVKLATCDLDDKINKRGQYDPEW